jgi:hypothetical protein
MNPRTQATLPRAVLFKRIASQRNRRTISCHPFRGLIEEKVGHHRMNLSTYPHLQLSRIISGILLPSSQGILEIAAGRFEGDFFENVPPSPPSYPRGVLPKTLK